MKRILIILVLATSTISAICQDVVSSSWNNMPFLAGVHKARFVLDLSNATINGVDATDFKEMDPDWDDGVREMKMKFIRAFNNVAANGIHPLRIGLNTESPVTFIVIVQKVTEDGSHVDGVFEVRDQENKLLFAKPVSAEEGHFGSQLNLMGDALEEMGEKLAHKIAGSIKYTAPKVNDKELKESIKDIIANNGSIALAISFSEGCKDQIYGQDNNENLSDTRIAELNTIFRDAFFKSLVKSYGNSLSEDQVFVCDGNPNGATMKITFYALYRRIVGGIRMDFLYADVILTTPTGGIVSGVIENGESIRTRNLLTKQMQDHGKQLGKIK